MTIPARVAAFAAAFALLASSCGGSATASDSEAAGATAQGAPAATDAASVEGEIEPNLDASSSEAKTLDDYLGVAAGFIRGGGPGAGASIDSEQFIEEQRLIEQEIQICMQEQGFEYTPVEQNGGLRFFLAQAGQGLSAQEYAATEGFGISTPFDAVLEGDVDFGATDDPNQVYVESLSEGEADAYEVALRGQPPERNAQGQLIDPDTGEVIAGGGGPGRLIGGCTGTAQTTVRGDFSVLAELGDEFDELDARIEADPRIAQITRDWAECMRGAGFAYETEAEAREEIRSQFLPLIRSFFGRGAGQGQGQQQGGGANPLADLELSSEQEAELKDLQDREIAIAIASLECAGETDQEIEEITARYEAEFVEANRATLESISG